MDTQEKILNRLQTLGFPELAGIDHLNEFDGSFLNLKAKLPNGQTAQILDNNKRYFAIEVELEGQQKCWGVAADDQQIAIFTYAAGGTDAELIAWVKI